MYVILMLCLDLNKLFVFFIFLKIKCCNFLLLNDMFFLKMFCDMELCDECYVFGDVF